jgi:uncharacterized protein YceK
MSGYAKTQFYPRHIDSFNEKGRVQPNTLENSVKKASVPGLVLLALLILLNLSGCGIVESSLQMVDNNVQYEVVSQPVIVTEEKVWRNPPTVHIYPITEVAGLKVLFVPFRVTQNIAQPELIGYGVSKLFWQTWASMQVFDYMEFLPDAGPFRADSALRDARAKGADLVVSGYVTNLMSGGEVAQSTLALQLEAYDVSSGSMVWSMSQAGGIAKPVSIDYVIFKTQSKISTDPIYALTTALAQDMGKVMRGWSKPEEKSAESNTEN